MIELNAKKYFANLKLASKVAVLMLAVIVLSSLAFFTAIRWGWAQSLYAAHHAKGIAVAQHLAVDIVEPLLLDKHVRLPLTLTQVITKNNDGDIVYAFLTDRQGVVIAHTFGQGFPKDLLGLNQPKPGADSSILAITAESGLCHDIAVPVLHGDAGYLHVGLAATSIVREIERITVSIFAICFGVAALALFTTILLVRYMTKPLGALTQGAQAIANGDFGHRVSVDGHDEIGLVSEAFNRMAAALEEDTRRRLAAEEALRKSESIYRTLVENIDLGIILIDRDHNVVMANASQGRLFCKDPVLFNGKKCYAEFEKRAAVCEHCPGVAAMARGRGVERYVEGVRDDGSRTYVKIQAFPVIGADGRATGFIEVVEDITKRKRLEEELQQAKKIEAIGLLAGGIAHDFNNLLTGILGNASLAKLYVQGNEKASARIEEMEKAAKRASSLTKQLLTFAKGGVPVLAATDLEKLIRETVSFVLSGSLVRADYRLAKDLWPIEADSGQISQVLQNLALNAKQAMADGGVLEIQAENVEIAEDGNLQLVPGRYVHVLVIDHGLGIPPEHIGRVFEPYFSTKSKGSGLGLAVCYSIVKKHGGLITVRATPPGTTFDLYLPAAQGQLEKAEPSIQEFTGQGRILVMDDEEVVRDVAGEMLGLLGLAVEFAKDGEEAIAIYKRAVESGQRFDLVIMDLSIPGGMGGKEAIAILRGYDPSVKAIVSSGYSDDPVMGDCRAYGFVGVISKPYDVETLRHTLQEIL